MSWYYQDEVIIIPVTRSAKYGKTTEGTSFKSKAYVEQDDRIQYGTDGQPVEPRQRVFLPFSTVVSKGDFLQINKILGRTVTEDKRTVRSITPVGSLKGSHLEIVV